MNPVSTTSADVTVEQSARLFIARVAEEYEPTGAVLFGSRARGDHRSNSDVDLAVLLPGTPGSRVDVALKFAGIAFDVLLETGVLIEAVPFWEEEWKHPEAFPNPALIRNIQQDGLAL